MNILVINAGSSSLKYQLIDMSDESVVAKGLCERIGIAGSKLSGKGKGGNSFEIASDMPTHDVAIKMVLDNLVSEENGVIASMDEIVAVGHRVLHSGLDFKGSVLVDDSVMVINDKNAELGPLHMPANISGIKACQAAMPTTPNVCVFDTAFHSTMPDYAALYAIPYEAYTDWNIKKYGFHGTSHQFVSGEAAKYLGRNDLKIVTCHLGNGSSLACVKDGICIDTTMGLTPLEGVPMGTRSGDIDPAAIEFISHKSGMTVEETITYLNKKSGMLGISGVSSDFRDLCKGAEEGHERCKLALDMFNYHVKKYVGSFIAVMGGVDCIVFTGGVGENTEVVRNDVLSTLGYAGVEIDPELNKKYSNGKVYANGITEIQSANSKVKVLVIPTNEELVIARETLALACN
ncbi:MAG: acetate kinase [Bacillota bacterium]